MVSDNALALILAGGVGKRLYPLTARRCKPAVPFGGGFRIIDFALFNCLHSGLRRVHVLAEYQAESLLLHCEERWKGENVSGGIEVLVHRPRGRSRGYGSTGGAVLQNLDVIGEAAPDDVLILSGDHVYRADYRRFLKAHRSRRADLTILCGEVPAAEAGRFGVLKVDGGGRISALIEKPLDPRPFSAGGLCPVSLGVYCFRRRFLIEQLLQAPGGDAELDFGRDVLPRAVAVGRVFACPLREVCPDPEPYWRDVGTVDSFFEAHRDLLGRPAAFRLRDRRWEHASPFHHWAPHRSASEARVAGRSVEGVNLVSGGATLQGAEVVNSVLSPDAVVGPGAEVEECILFPGAEVGEGALLWRVIVEEGVRVSPGACIGRGEAPAGEAESGQGVVVVSETECPSHLGRSNSLLARVLSGAAGTCGACGFSEVLSGSLDCP